MMTAIDVQLAPRGPNIEIVLKNFRCAGINKCGDSGSTPHDADREITLIKTATTKVHDAVGQYVRDTPHPAHTR